ncbi:hypothetical protein XENOCAPTIV_030296 [Xenoophorus captivus]|uniref:Uncharacterized protein n=1 Tax=Xenoophorus captivus TaxID=1517983 RepID=A0ABV0R3C2_9TELE
MKMRPKSSSLVASNLPFLEEKKYLISPEGHYLHRKAWKHGNIMHDFNSPDNMVKYHQILEENLLTSARTLNMAHGGDFQCDKPKMYCQATNQQGIKYLFLQLFI